jgi:hypothetical protein
LVVTTAGKYDIVVYALFKTSREPSRFLRTDLTGIPGIMNTEIMIMPEMHKMFFKYLAAGDAVSGEDC